MLFIPSILEGGDKKQKDTYLELGNACESNGEYQKAIQHYQKALNIALERRDKCQEGKAYLGLGCAYVNIGQYQTSIEHYRKALNIAQDRKDKLQERQAYRGLGDVYQKVKDLPLKREEKCKKETCS